MQQQLSKEQTTVQELRTRLKEGEVDAANSQKEAHERVSQLQKELIRYQEQSVSREFEMKGQLCRLTSDLESARKENADITAHVTLLKAQLANQQELLSQTQAQLVERRQELQASTDALGAEKAKNQATIKELSQELQSFRAERGDKDALLKSQLIKDTRQTRAFQEIKRLIDWATTPPSSARSSGGIRGVDATTPCSGAVAGMPSHTGGDLGSPVLSSAVELQHLGRIDELADAAAPPHLPVSSTSQVSHRQNKPLAAAALYRLRSSLTALAAVEVCDVTLSPPMSPQQHSQRSPHQRSQAHPKGELSLSHSCISSPRLACDQDHVKLKSPSLGVPAITPTRSSPNQRHVTCEAHFVDDDIHSPSVLRSSRDQAMLA
ncbi:hypothetical protein V8C86DRAFT_512568 [Haematococcus lacustris]